MSRDPYSKGVDSDVLKASSASRGTFISKEEQEDPKSERMSGQSKPEEPPEDVIPASSTRDVSDIELLKDGEKTLQDAVKPKHKRKRNASSAAHAS